MKSETRPDPRSNPETFYMEDARQKNDRNFPIPKNSAIRLRWLLALASVLFAAGIFSPMVTISKFIIAKNSFSVVSGVVELLLNGRIVLFAVVSGFSLVLPLIKIIVLFKLLFQKEAGNPKTDRLLHLMHEYGRWAMLDVLVMAILIVTVKLGAIASIDVHFGLYVFGAAVLLMMIVTKGVVHLTGQSGAGGKTE